MDLINGLNKTPSYGYAPGYLFDDWAKITWDEWNDPKYWESLGINQWGPEPLKMEEEITPEFFTQQRGAWTDWLKSQPKADWYSGVDIISQSPYAEFNNTTPAQSGLKTEITGQPVQEDAAIFPAWSQPPADTITPGSGADVNIDTVDTIKQLITELPQKVSMSGSSTTNTTGGRDSVSTATAGLADPAARELLASLLGDTAALSPYYAQGLEQFFGLPQSIDTWTNDLIQGYRTRNDQIVNAMNAVANQRASQNILQGSESENLRANTLAALAQTENDQRNAALTNALGLKTGVIGQFPNAGKDVVDSIYKLLGLTDQQKTETENVNTWEDAVRLAEEYQYTENPQGWMSLLLGLLNFV